jgi:phosphatidylethanolamine-binding protein (PEBP) family uncharacterized protein
VRSDKQYGAPAGTKSFVVTLFDRDERSTPSGWWHWVVYDLPNNVDKLPAGAGAEHTQAMPAESRQGRSPALNVAKLDVPADSSGAMVTSTAQDHLLGKAVFIAHYGR